MKYTNIYLHDKEKQAGYRISRSIDYARFGPTHKKPVVNPRHQRRNDYQAQILKEFCMISYLVSLIFSTIYVFLLF